MAQEGQENEEEATENPDDDLFEPGEEDADELERLPSLGSGGTSPGICEERDKRSA